jgi:hypothetical protein
MTPMTPQKRTARRKAREKIIAAANAHQHRLGMRDSPYNHRTIQRAVCVVRRNKLVKPAVIASAGYNPIWKL